MNLSSKQQEFITMPFTHTLDVAEGTPRSGKTTACIARYFLFLNVSKDENHLIVAATQQQAFRLVLDGDGNGLLHLFQNAMIKHDDHGDHLEAITPNGVKKIYYKGGAKADSDKAIRGLSLGSIYFCEIDILHMNMIQECFRRTYAAHIRWHLADLNPPAPRHPVITDVFDVQDTKWTHWTVNDNPILTEERKKDIHDTLIKNPYLYKRDWLGERTIPQGVIYSMFNDSEHIIDRLPEGFAPYEMMFSGDGGLTDATSISCNIIGKMNNKFIMIRVANWYYDGANKAMSVQAREIVSDFVPYCRHKYSMRETCWKIDPACKALRKEFEILGIYTDKADNNAKDVKGNRKGIEVGIEYLQSAISDGRFFVVNDEKYGCHDFLKEIGMYCVDDNGHPIDAYNHAMDECRYANNYFYKRYVL